VKTYRIVTDPTYCDGTPLVDDRFAVGALVHVKDDEFTPDSDGDVGAYPVGEDRFDWRYINVRHLAGAATLDRADAVHKAREILGAEAPVDSLIKLAEYLQGGAA
jgi:hypothetical protein